MNRLSNGRWVVWPAGLLIFLLTACSGGTSATKAASSPAGPVTSATSTTTVAPTASSTESSLPTYSEVVATYPANANTCDTEAVIKPGGSYSVTGGSIQMVNGQFRVPCYGIKVTVKQRVSIKGKTYVAGTKLTVDKNMELTPVSGWD